MTAAFKPVARVQVSGNNPLAVYDRAGALLGTERVEEYSLFRLSNLVANAPQTISLEKIGYAIKPETIYLLNPSSVNNLILTITYSDGQTSSVNYMVSNDFVMTNGLIFPEDSKLTIEIDGTATGAVIHAKQVGIVELQAVPFD